MIHLYRLTKSLSVLILLPLMFLAGGCGETAQPPTPISLDQIPAEMGKAFASAKGDTKELSGAVVAAVQAKDFPRASMALQALAQRTDLDKVQNRTTAGAALTVNAALLEAESKGDKRAAETLNVRRLTK